MNWLDTQTREILQKVNDTKLAPPKAADFALVLVREGSDHRRLVRAISRINECDEATASELAVRPNPVTINFDLTEENALWGQFELVCCDAISVFFRSEVLEQMDRAYLQSLYDQTSKSSEFHPTTVEIKEIPTTESGQKFVDQFLGRFDPASAGVFPKSVTVPFKKARLMQHWATRVGAKIQYHAK